MRLYIDHFLPRVLSKELRQRGFVKSSTSVPNEVVVFIRNSVRVEIRGGDSVAVVARGFEERHEGLSLPNAMSLIDKAKKLADAK